MRYIIYKTILLPDVVIEYNGLLIYRRSLKKLPGDHIELTIDINGAGGHYRLVHLHIKGQTVTHQSITTTPGERS